ncbi:MAG: hypothetical protein ACKV2V_26940 [Blastocatellia bacterium]
MSARRLPAPVWLFSARIDMLVFAGAALVSMLALLAGWRLGLLDADAPDAIWIAAVVMIDVAHVHATGFRVYLDTEEFRRRPALYALAPALGLALGIALYAEGSLLFWRALAYLAVFHFVRQQYGWVALYRAKAAAAASLPAGAARMDKWIDNAAIYAATLYPLYYWHASLPRRFTWFIENDFFSGAGGLLQGLLPLAEILYWLALAIYFLRAGWLAATRRAFNPGKDLIVLTTALCWRLGIVTFNSDYAFTVTNVIIHGVPYMALIYLYARRRLETTSPPGGVSLPLLRRAMAGGWPGFIAILWALALLEELFWDRAVWHERAWLFGAGWDAESWKALLVPLLALPQITHYLLDGFIWRRKDNPDLVWK